MPKLTLILHQLRDVAMVTNQFWGPFAYVQIDMLQSLLWRFAINCNMSTNMRALTTAIMLLYRVKYGPVTTEITRVECAISTATRLQFADPSP